MAIAEFRRLVCLVLAACLVATTGCTSFSVVPVSGRSADPAAVRVGERVRVTEDDGKVLEFDVRHVEPDGLRGRDVRVAFADIAMLEVRRFDKRRTWILAGTLGGVLVTAAAIAAYVATGYSRIWTEAQ